MVLHSEQLGVGEWGTLANLALLGQRRATVIYDNVSFLTTPEPGQALLWLSGFGNGSAGTARDVREALAPRNSQISSIELGWEAGVTMMVKTSFDLLVCHPGKR